MQLFSRAEMGGTKLNALVSTLSLAMANYKPIPQLPTTSQVTIMKDTTPAKQLTAGGITLQQATFQTKTDAKSGSTSSSSSSITSSTDDNNSNADNIAEWGQASVLYVEKTTPNSRVTSKSATIGPGGCPIQTAYTPVGGMNALPAPEFAAFDATMANVYRYRQQQGVNLGGWFVQEGWMQGKFFSCSGGNSSSEMDILLGFGSTADGISNATAYYEQHWDTWITEADFKKMASIGINTVRIPIGYWSAGPYFTQHSPFSTYGDVYYYSWSYIARAINWAAKYDIGVLIDLHGAYGSQNGQDHSGLSSGVIGFFDSKHMGLTTDLLVWLTGQLANVTNLVGIELLNEPVNRASLWPWYYTTMDAMRQVSATVPLYFHDAFSGSQGSAFVANRTDFVVQDHHSYYVYTSSDIAESAKGHITDINGSIRSQYDRQSANARRNVVQGEWSCALAPNSLSQASNQSFAQTNFCTDQEAVYRETSAGFMFWSWTMDSCGNNGGWCFQQAIKSFLPATFDSWGLINVTAPMFNLATTASSGLSDLINQISQVSLPDMSTTSSSNKVVKVKTINTKNISRITKSGTLSESPRIGMIERTGSGSLASRANEIVQMEKRASSSTSGYASASGWSDGFLSAQIFATQGTLSRIGFARQYEQDSFNLRLAAGEVVKSDSYAYNATFIAGIQAAENIIAQLIDSVDS